LPELASAAAGQLPTDPDVEELKLAERPAFRLRAKKDVEEGRAAPTGAEHVDKRQLDMLTISRRMIAWLRHRRRTTLGSVISVQKISDGFVIVWAFL
jgi:hypothetical protein